MSEQEVVDEKTLEAYCNQGMEKTDETEGDSFLRLNNPQKITIIVTVDFGDGYVARKIHTIQARVYWMLHRNKELLHICEDFIHMKDAVYTMRRLKFGPHNTSFLMTGKQKEDKQREEMKENLKKLEML